MIIVNKERTELYMAEHIGNIYISAGRTYAIKVRTNTGTQGGTMAEYDTETEAKTALKIVMRDIAAKKEIIYMPEEKEIKAAVANDKEVWHHATGKKTKGHGGS